MKRGYLKALARELEDRADRDADRLMYSVERIGAIGVRTQYDCDFRRAYKRHEKSVRVVDGVPYLPVQR